MKQNARCRLWPWSDSTARYASHISLCVAFIRAVMCVLDMKFGLFCAWMVLGVMVGRAGVVPSGFSEATFQLPGVNTITDIEWAPDTTSRLFIAQKEGPIRILKRGQLVPIPFAVIQPVYAFSECGVVGMCFDPNFLVNRYVYFFVTVSSGEQQIIRYEDADDVGINKTVLISGLPTIGQNHDGGGLAVGLDGLIYFSIGDQGPGIGVNADLTTLASKVGRRRRDGSVPALNPFVDGPGGNDDSIWARGFRNPFKLAVQPSTGLIWVNVAGSLYEQIFAVQKGDHAGWNNYENNQPNNFIKPRIKYRTNGTDTRQIAAGGAYWHDNVMTFTTTAAHFFRKGERIAIAGVLDPAFNGFFYVQSTPSATTFSVARPGAHAASGGGTATTANLGGAVTGGCFYNATDFPDEYRQNYFFCDLNSGRINRATFDASNEVASVDYFISGINNAVDVTTAPNGYLFYASFGHELIYRVGYNNTAQKIVLSPNYLNMSEGGLAVAHVRLAIPPATDVAITVSAPAGSAAISTTNVTLTFTPANYATTQPLYVEAVDDDNRFHSQAIFTLSAPGLADRRLHVNAYDRDHGALAFTSVLRTNQLTRFQVASEPRTRVALEASTNLAAWQPFATNLTITNAATLFDPSPALPHRYYRARVVP